MGWNILYNLLWDNEYFITDEGYWDSEKFNKFIDNLKKDCNREFLEKQRERMINMAKGLSDDDLLDLGGLDEMVADINETIDDMKKELEEEKDE